MMILRNLIFYLGLIPVTFLLALLLVSLFFMPFRVRYFIAMSWSYFFIYWAKWTCGISFQVLNRHHLPKKNAIIVSNHQSMWETLFMQVLLPAQSLVLKRELLFIPFFGWGLYLIEPIAIRRNKLNSISELIKQGLLRLKQGRYVIIFPEGTRVAANHVGKFSRTAAKLSDASGVPIIPIAHNAGVFWPRGFFIKKPGMITVTIGPSISPEGKTPTEINDQARHWIETHLPTPHPTLSPKGERDLNL